MLFTQNKLFYSFDGKKKIIKLFSIYHDTDFTWMMVNFAEERKL